MQSFIKAIAITLGVLVAFFGFFCVIGAVGTAVEWWRGPSAAEKVATTATFELKASWKDADRYEEGSVLPKYESQWNQTEFLTSFKKSFEAASGGYQLSEKQMDFVRFELEPRYKKLVLDELATGGTEADAVRLIALFSATHGEEIAKAIQANK